MNSTNRVNEIQASCRARTQWFRITCACYIAAFFWATIPWGIVNAAGHEVWNVVVISLLLLCSLFLIGRIFFLGKKADKSYMDFIQSGNEVQAFQLKLTQWNLVTWTFSIAVFFCAVAFWGIGNMSGQEVWYAMAMSGLFIWPFIIIGRVYLTNQKETEFYKNMKNIEETGDGIVESSETNHTDSI